MFILGLLIGIFIGASVSLFLYASIVAGKNAESKLYRN